MSENNITLIEAINKAFIRRKYYLNRNAKKFSKILSRKKCLEISEKKVSELKGKEKKYMKELCSVYGYNVQIIIPNDPKNN